MVRDLGNVIHVQLVKMVLAFSLVVPAVNIIQGLGKQVLKIWMVAEVHVLNEVNLA
jgi:hypothetical protein